MSMQIVIIEHMRCFEYSGAKTILWAPAEWTIDDVRFHAREAQEAFLKNWDEWRAEPVPANATQYGPTVLDYQAHPDKTVAEVDADFARRREAYSEWDANREKGHKTFEDFLVEAGFTPLWRHKAELGMSLDWGHRHGQRLGYSGPESQDLPGPLPREDPFD